MEEIRTTRIKITEKGKRDVNTKYGQKPQFYVKDAQGQIYSGWDQRIDMWQAGEEVEFKYAVRPYNGKVYFNIMFDDKAPQVDKLDLILKEIRELKSMLNPPAF